MSIFKKLSDSLLGKQKSSTDRSENETAAASASGSEQETRTASTDSQGHTHVPAHAKGDSQSQQTNGTLVGELWSEGQEVFDEFVVERELGQGGFGKVYLLVSRKTGERFAVKRALLADSNSRSDFLSELQSWINLPAHPHLVACRFFRTTGDEIAIFAEYADAGSLKDWIESGRLYEGGKAAALERILDIAIQFASGLSAAHELGLVHQDVKPGNVMMMQDGQVKVGDFGLTKGKVESPEMERIVDYLLQDIGEGEPYHQVKAKLLEVFDEQEKDKTIEVPHRGALTQPYASPEQLAKEPLTRRADIWSWGVSIMELFNGEVTWYSGTVAAEVLRELKQNGPSVSHIPELPERVVSVLDLCFRQNPTERWSTLADAANVLIEVYRENFNREYTRSQPTLPTRKQQAHARRLPSGSYWQDPRLWLQRAYEAAGRNPAEAEAFWPERRGTVKAQAIADLRALEHAQEIFEQLVRAGEEGTELSGDLARLYGNIAMVHRSLDDDIGALRKYEQCIALLRRGTQPNERHDLVIALNGLAILLREMGRRQESIKICDQAIEESQALLAERSEDEGLLANAYLTKANALDNKQEKLMLYDEAASIFAEMNEADGMARSLAAKAGALIEIEDYGAAHKTYELAEAKLKALIDQERRIDLEPVLATLMSNRAICYERERDLPSALRFIEEAIRLYEPLVYERGKSELEDALALAFFKRGEILEASGQPLPACESYSKARKILSNVVLHEGRSDLADELARALQFEATLLRNIRQHEAALSLAQESVSLWQRLAQLNPEPAWRAKLAHAQTVLGPCLVESGDTEGGVNHLNEAVATFRQLKDEEDTDVNTMGLAAALLEMGAVMRKIGNGESSVRAYDWALKNLEALDTVESRKLEALVNFNLSNVLFDLGYKEDALHHIGRSIEISEGLVAKSGLAHSPEELVAAYQNKANKLMRMGKTQDALPLYKLAAPILERLITKEGRDDLRFELFRLWAAQGMTEEKLFELRPAINSFTRAIELAGAATNMPQSPEVTASLKLLQRKIKDISALLNINPRDYEELERKAESLIEQGQQIGRAGEVEYSISLYSEAILIYTQLQQAETRPDWLAGCANAYLHKALASMRVSNFETAEDCYRVVIKLYDQLIDELKQGSFLTDWAIAAYGLGRLLSASNRNAEAKEILSQIKTRLGMAVGTNNEQLLAKVDEMLQEIDSGV